MNERDVCQIKEERYLTEVYQKRVMKFGKRAATAKQQNMTPSVINKKSIDGGQMKQLA